jgi:hypothetical protein
MSNELESGHWQSYASGDELIESFGVDGAGYDETVESETEPPSVHTSSTNPQ